jgi:hypothetical protein
MELHRPRPKFFWLGFFLLGGLALIWASQNGWQLRILIVPVGAGPLLVVGVVMVLGVLAVLAGSFRFAPMMLDGSGLRLRVAGINRSVPWASIDAVILEPHTGTLDSTGAPRLVLVPSADADLGVVAEYRNKVDGRPSIILLSLDSLRESQDHVVRAFKTYGGERFINGLPCSETETELPR